jgi:hypothetical protein
MDVNREYELLEAIPGAGPRSFRARRNSSGQEVTLHLLPGGKTPENESVMMRLRKLPPLSQAKLVQIGEDQGSNVVVTAAPPHLHLLEWLAAEERGAQPEPGEFTRLFQAPPRAPVNEPPPKPTEAPSRQAGPAPKSGERAGEFTRMFQTSAAKPPERPKEPSTPTKEPGEFTRLFQSQVPAPKEPEPKESSAAPAPGEFTKFFRGSPPEGAPAPAFPPATLRPAAPPPPAPAPPPADDQGGEFTRIFGRPGLEPKAPSTAETPLSAPPPPPPLPAPQTPGPSEYTQLIRPRSIPTPPANQAPPPAAVSAPQTPAVSVPQPAMPVVPQPPVPATPQAPVPKLQPAAAAPQANWILMAIVGIICFLAGGLVVFLLMKH